MAAEGERKTVRKRNAPHRLIEDDKEEAALSTKEAKESKRSIVITDSSDEDHVSRKEKVQKGKEEDQERQLTF
ncbi:hypothetical protein G5714_024554 [Onychostoma macrolepis]|uniref:Uncharacterized protein n=1 Tax=Onychostoma macrolepis TaxID=369639 RepID=A0A7J6BLW8_9TELE|nr:hypothetical protein G5714_024554 [Onychostoma macrolepis]